MAGQGTNTQKDGLEEGESVGEGLDKGTCLVCLLACVVSRLLDVLGKPQVILLYLGPVAPELTLS